MTAIIVNNSEFMEKILDTELAVSRKLVDFCIQNDIEFPETVFIQQWFAGLDSTLILSKISPTATPLIDGALNFVH